MAFQNRIIACFFVCIFCLLLVSGGMSPANAQGSGEVIDIGSHLELFADKYLIDKLSGTRLKLHEPKQAGIAIKFDKPW